jgi:RHS repeat-associated protein
MERDTETANDHTWFRGYEWNLGRWMSPDPAGLAAADPSNPQSWNRYAYVLNNPTSLTDPLGLGDCGGDLSFDCNNNGEPPPPPGHGSGGGIGVSTDPSSDCSYTATNDASCGQPAGLWPNGTPIFGGSGARTSIWGGGLGSGLGDGPLSGDYGVGLPPLGGGSALPCDFGTCSPGVGGAGYTSAGILQYPWYGTIIRSTAWACGLNPAACIAAGVAGADVALLGWDVYHGYHLLQAYGLFLPKATSLPKSQIRPHPPEVEKACSEALDEYMNKPRRGGGDPGSCYRECLGAGGIWPDYKCPR